MKIAYFVHNLDDPVIAKRLSMLHRGGVDEVVVFGFRRGDEPFAAIGGSRVIELGHTKDGGFAGRIGHVALAAATLGRFRQIFAGCDAFLGRSLEGMQLAALARSRFAPGARLGYECLDIHRLMLHGPLARGLRAIEQRLIRKSDVIFVSAPDYLTEYFAVHYDSLPPVVLLENKVLDSDLSPDGTPPAIPLRPVGPPWRIGWYGALRCRESLGLLADLARRMNGRVEIVIRGIPSPLELPDFDEVIAGTPHMSFHGRYDRSRDLPELYGDVHFAWAIERFEKGGNGRWQLVNRLYEAGVFGAVLIAERSVGVGRWLSRRHAGLLVGDDVLSDLVGTLEKLDEPRYLSLESAARDIPKADLIADTGECRRIAEALAGTSLTPFTQPKVEYSGSGNPQSI